jgi:hypothetical protein
MAIVATVNSRRIIERAPIGTYVAPWFTVECDSVASDKGERLAVFQVRHTLADAITLAESLGPMTDQPDAP